MSAQRTTSSPRTPVGRHVIDLAAAPSASARIAEYEAVFGHLSPLHQRHVPAVVSRGAMTRLRSLVHLPSRA